jgi:DNA-binding MarR family transcriptional regulator
MKSDKNTFAPPLLVTQIGVLYRSVRKKGSELFHEQNFPLDLDQIPVLLIAWYSEGSSQQELCVTLQRDKASINRTVTFLVAKGYANVEANAADKRKTTVTLTAEGKKLARQAHSILSQFNAMLSSVLSSAEQTQFQKITGKLIQKESSTTLSFSI